MPVKEKLDQRDAILNYLKAIERNLAWLSRKVDEPYNTMYSIFVQRTFDLGEERLAAINKVLGTSF